MSEEIKASPYLEKLLHGLPTQQLCLVQEFIGNYLDTDIGLEENGDLDRSKPFLLHQEVQTFNRFATTSVSHSTENRTSQRITVSQRIEYS